MNNSATVFKPCIAHHYWHHMDDPKRFFKIMVGDFKNGVTIPKKFVANIREQMSEQVTLKVPDGKTYTIEVAGEQQNELVLRSGWAEFASAYGLEEFDLLVFKNTGNSHLKVRIFDRSGCEKELSCVLLDSIPCIQRKGSHGKQMESPTGKRLAVGSPSGSRKTLKMNPVDSPSQKKRHVSPTKRHGVAKPPHMLPRHTSLTDEQRSKVEEKFGAMQSETPKMNPTDSPLQKKRHVSPTKRYGVAMPPYMLPQHKSLTDEQSKVEEKVGAVQSETPKMNPTDSPSQKKKHVSPTKRHGVAMPPYMPPRYTSISDEQRSKVEEKVGAVQSETPKVNPTDSPSQKKRHVSPTKRHEGAKPPYILPRHTSQTDEQRSELEEKVGAIQSETPKMNPTDSPSQKKSIHQEPINSGASQKLIKSCIDLPTGCSMTSEQEAKVISLEQKIQPKIPFYITAMHEKSVASGILAIKKKYAIKHLVNENGTIQLCQLDGSKVWVWPIKLDITADDCCAVSKGWMGFIRHNKLQEGDICIFQPSKSKKGVKLMFHPLVQSRCLQPPGYFPSAKSLRHGAAKPPYMLPFRTSLTDEQKSKVEEKLRGIQSEIPIYVAVMKNSNVNGSLWNLGFGAKYAREYLPSESENQLTMMLRRKDHTWEPDFQIRDGRRLILGKGWRKFVTDNTLKPDDICLFNLRKNTKTLMMDVYIVRK